MATCPIDGTTFTAISPRHTYCQAKCRQQASRLRAKAALAPDSHGRNLVAAQKTVTALTHADVIDSARIQAFLTLAAAVDSAPGNPALWARYLEAERGLRDLVPGEESKFGQLQARLRAVG